MLCVRLAGRCGKAAVDAQKAISSAEWKDAVIKVRMGIHCGEAVWNRNDYTGYVTLARTHRIMSSACGEQIITSGIVYSDAADFLPSSVSFRDLGERRLKDLNQPVRLYQVCAEDCGMNFRHSIHLMQGPTIFRFSYHGLWEGKGERGH